VSYTNPVVSDAVFADLAGKSGLSSFFLLLSEKRGIIWQLVEDCTKQSFILGLGPCARHAVSSAKVLMEDRLQSSRRRAVSECYMTWAHDEVTSGKEVSTRGESPSCVASRSAMSFSMLERPGKAEPTA
jgi:hypothetical protein